jgi:hypothetical protein
MKKATVFLIVLSFLFSSVSIVLAGDVDPICLDNFQDDVDVCQMVVTNCIAHLNEEISDVKQECADLHKYCVHAAIIEFNRCKMYGPLLPLAD